MAVRAKLVMPLKRSDREDKMRKWILAACLAALLLVGCVLAEDVQSLRVVQATDMHYFSPSLAEFDEELLEAVYALDGKVIHYSFQICKAFVRDMLNLRPDAVILSGDLTLNGELQNHREFSELLIPLREAGIQVLTLPGNHDVGSQGYLLSTDGAVSVPATSAGEFFEFYEGYGYADALARDPDSLSYIAKLSDSVWAVMLDVNANSVPGFVMPATLTWLEKQLQAAQRASVTVIGVSHQTLLNHYGIFSQGVVIGNAEKLQELYKKYGVRLNLSGHTHLQHIMAPEDGPMEIVTASMAVAPGYYGVITLDGKELETYQAIPVDVNGWAAEAGETNPDLLNFSAYTEAFFREVSRRKMVNTVSDPSIPEEDRQRMLDFAVDMNYCDFAGLRAEVKDPGALALWEKYLPNTFRTYYMDDLLTDSMEDMIRYSFAKE